MGIIKAIGRVVIYGSIFAAGYYVGSSGEDRSTSSEARNIVEQYEGRISRLEEGLK